MVWTVSLPPPHRATARATKACQRTSMIFPPSCQGASISVRSASSSGGSPNLAIHAFRACFSRFAASFVVHPLPNVKVYPHELTMNGGTMRGVPALSRKTMISIISHTPNAPPAYQQSALLPPWPWNRLCRQPRSRATSHMASGRARGWRRTRRACNRPGRAAVARG